RNFVTVARSHGGSKRAVRSRRLEKVRESAHETARPTTWRSAAWSRAQRGPRQLQYPSWVALGLVRHSPAFCAKPAQELLCPRDDITRELRGVAMAIDTTKRPAKRLWNPEGSPHIA